MPIFKIEDKKLISIKEVIIDLEKDLQKLTENNIEAVLGYKFISSEFSLHAFRIDTLAFDEETKSFVIIEYKKDRSFSVIDQGFSYLSLMLNNKADFILEYNEKTNRNFKKDDIDWTQSRVLFLANSFTSYQQNAISFRDLPIELWEIKKYDNNTILYNQLKTAESNESIKTISKNKNIEQVSREVKKYTLADHLKEGWEESGNLYELISEKILALDSRLEEKFNTSYIGFKIKTRLLCAVHIQKTKLRLDIVGVDKEDLKDPDDKVIKVKWEENNWGKQCSYLIANGNDIDYAMFLIKQVYEKLHK
jgi:predicted transport protein